MTDTEEHDDIESTFKNVDILLHIISFVGVNQYRFVAAINKEFQTAYLQLYPNNKKTYYNASTLKHTVICFECFLDKRHEYGNWITEPLTKENIGGLARLMSYPCMESPTNVETCQMAARHGQLYVLQYLRVKGCPWDASTCSEAMKWGHAHIVRWARTNGCPWDKWTCTYAAMQGDLATLQWARANRCRWTKDTCTYAAQYGHLDVLQWTIANGGRFNEIDCFNAARPDYEREMRSRSEGNQPRSTVWEWLIATYP
jgi:hypothetical protein